MVLQSPTVEDIFLTKPNKLLSSEPLVIAPVVVLICDSKSRTEFPVNDGALVVSPTEYRKFLTWPNILSSEEVLLAGPIDVAKDVIFSFTVVRSAEPPPPDDVGILS